MRMAAASTPARGRPLPARRPGGGSAPLSGPALALHLQRTAGNRATARLLRQLGPDDDIWSIPDPPPAGAAGGCGLCYEEKFKGAVGPREAGSEAHRIIQGAMRGKYADLLPYELEVRTPRGKKGFLDLARFVGDDRLEIGEIKPADSDEDAINDLDWYISLLNKAHPDWDIGPLKLPAPTGLTFPTLSENCPTQRLNVANTHGVYLYFCEPSYAQLLAQGCRCKKRSRRKSPDPPVIFDKTKRTRSLKDLLKKGPPKTRLGPPTTDKPPRQIPDRVDWEKVLGGVAIALAVVGIIAAIVMSPVGILASIASAIGWTIARLLAALGLGMAGASLAAADTGDGKAAKTGGPPKPVPSAKGPVRKVPRVDPGTKGPPAEVAGTKGPPAGAPAKGRQTPARGPVPPGPKADKRKPPATWSVIEGFDPGQAWVGQELWVWDGRPPAVAKSWMLTVKKIERGKNGTTVTLESFAEVEAQRRVPEGNTYTVTHPFKADPGQERQPQAVLSPLKEPAGMRAKIPPLKNRGEPGWGLLLGLLARISYASGGEEAKR